MNAKRQSVAARRAILALRVASAARLSRRSLAKAEHALSASVDSGHHAEPAVPSCRPEAPSSLRSAERTPM